MLNFHELVGTYDLSPIVPSNDTEAFCFRVEVFKDMGFSDRYFAKIYRLESYRLQPTFPTSSAEKSLDPADHEILVIDDMIGAEDYAAASKEQVLRNVQQHIQAVFSPLLLE